MSTSRIAVTFVAGSFVRLGSRHGISSPATFRNAPASLSRSTPRRARFVSSAATPVTTPLSSMKDRAVLDTDCVVPVLRPEQGKGVEVVSRPGLLELETELLVIAVRSAEEGKEFTLPKDVVEFDQKDADGAIAEIASDSEFVGKAGSSTDMLRIAGKSVKRVVLYGLGEGDAAVSVKAAAFAVSKGKAISSCNSVALYLDGGFEDAVAGAAEGACIAAHIDERFKGHKEKENNDSSKAKSEPPKQIVLVGTSGDLSADVARGQAFAAGIIAAKEVVTAPANSLTPEGLADAARLVAREAELEIKVLGREECKKLGMGCYLGVSQGSLREPQFIHLTYTPRGEAKQKVALVGKAVTFDTGGYNLKAGAGSMIELMKWDMGGSGAVLGAAAAIGRLKPADVEVHFIMPACENMISDRAIHPGDVLTASNGKTVEVINTDAEGRLCLADALVYAEKLGDLDCILDIATLTGAIIVSLGNDVAGFWTPNDALANDLTSAGKMGGEELWRMPLVQGYAEQLKSKIADLRNIGTGRAGSSITAALFLKEFVSLEKWSHIDIAGTAWADKKGGATAFGVKTLVNYIEKVAQAE